MTKLWCVHTSSWFSFDHLEFIWLFMVWTLLLHLSLPSHHIFLESHEWDFPMRHFLLIHKYSFEDSIIGSSRPFPCKCFFPFDDGGLLRFLIMINFHCGWGPTLGMLLLHEYIELYLPCSYILEDISSHAFCSHLYMLFLHEYLELYVLHASRF